MTFLYWYIYYISCCSYIIYYYTPQQDDGYYCIDSVVVILNDDVIVSDDVSGESSASGDDDRDVHVLIPIPTDTMFKLVLEPDLLVSNTHYIATLIFYPQTIISTRFCKYVRPQSVFRNVIESLEVYCTNML